jgi:hypothetical protein
VLISDDHKRQIMRELSQGNISSLRQVLSPPLEDNQDFDLKSYQNFDHFARRSSWDEQEQPHDQAFCLDPTSVDQVELEPQKAIARIQAEDPDNLA